VSESQKRNAVSVNRESQLEWRHVKSPPGPSYLTP